jgi:threonine/homoserine/homoserine lactone efflux protein
MSSDLLITAFLAAMAYVLIPGPATLAALHLSATRGRFASACFLGAHLIGDLAWSVFALLAIVGVTQLGADLFRLLGLACGIYLIWLGIQALRTTEQTATPIVADPLRTGFVFGLTNPKAYPFALAMFTTVLGTPGATVTLEGLPALFMAIVAGFIVADAIVVGWTGLAPVGRVFRRYQLWITRAIGLLFIAYGMKSIAETFDTSNLREGGGR